MLPGAENKLRKLDMNDKNIPHTRVVVYCTPWCPDCRRARAWLKENDIEYTEVDISTDLDAARQVRAWGGGYQISPTFEIDSEIILDFDQPKLTKLLLKK
jgi:thioredoxin reductase (NADPH)